MGCSGNEEQWIGPPGDLKYYKNKVYEKNYRVLYSGKYNERLGSYIEQGTVEDGNKTGKFIHLYPDGSLKMEGFYNGLGTKHGYFTYYYKTGEIEMEGLYEHGLEQGMWGLFYRNGQKKGELIFKDGVEQKTKILNSIS
jgi:antitoxin component YwqK of YwqJK toxin-antitoxin module